MPRFFMISYNNWRAAFGFVESICKLESFLTFSTDFSCFFFGENYLGNVILILHEHITVLSD